MENKLWNALKELKSEGYEWVELSHSQQRQSVLERHTGRFGGTEQGGV